MKQNHFSEILDGKGLRIAIVASRFNADLTDALLADCLEALSKCGVDHMQIKTVRVPGSFELPVMAAELIEHGDYDAIVCLGIIIHGETSHDKYIAHSVSESLNHLAITTRVPMIFGVLTTENKPGRSTHWVEERAGKRDECGGKGLLMRRYGSSQRKAYGRLPSLKMLLVKKKTAKGAQPLTTPTMNTTQLCGRALRAQIRKRVRVASSAEESRESGSRTYACHRPCPCGRTASGASRGRQQ